MGDGSWFLTRYGDIVPVYRDPKTFSSDKKKEFGPKYGATPLFEHHTTSLVFNDPPLHTRVRRAIVGALSQRHIAAMEPGLVRLVDSLLDALAQKRDVDLIEDFAAAIPVEIIGNLLGVPHDERGRCSAMVAGHPRRARAGADDRARRARQRAVTEMLALPEDAGRRAARALARCRHRRADATDRRRQRKRSADRGRAAAPVHFPAQCRARNDDQPDRQRAPRARRMAAAESTA